jgi:hypothetical protein
MRCVLITVCVVVPERWFSFGWLMFMAAVTANRLMTDLRPAAEKIRLVAGDDSVPALRDTAVELLATIRNAMRT